MKGTLENTRTFLFARFFFPARQVVLLFNNRNKKSVTDFNLTDREHEILSMLVQGLSYEMIADKCNVSYSMVNSHIMHIYENWHVKSVTENVAKALNRRLFNATKHHVNCL